MNKIKTLTFAGLLIAALSLLGCSQSFSGKNQSGKASVVFSLEAAGSRTALPGAVNWNDYKYTLTAVEGYGTAEAKAETTLYTSKAYTELNTPVSLNTAKYKFTMTAYIGVNPVLSGVAEADLTKGAAAVSFKMYAVAGSTGSAVITINLPDDNVIASIKAGWSTDATSDFNQTSKTSTLTIDTTETGRKAVYSVEGLAPAITQFAMIYMYDANGGLLATYPEGLMIVGGRISTSTIDITADDYHRYAASITLKRNGEKWLDSTKEISLVERTTGTSYVLKENKAVFAGNISEGTYVVYVNSIATSEIFTSTSKTLDLDYYTVEMTPGLGIDFNIVSGAEDFYGKYVIAKGKDLVYTPVLKPGFSTPGSFSITTNGSSKTATLGANVTIKEVSSAVTISSTGATPIKYRINYVVSASEGTWQAGANKPTEFDVTEDVDLPTAVDLRGNGKILDGWKLSPDATEGIGYIKAGEIYSDITLYPIWKDSAGVDTASKVIYANGISLIIKENAGKTNIYLDINRNGVIDASDDTQLVATNGNTDFTDYELRAGNKEGTPIASDFTFTMTGGRIASIQGMGANAANRSILNISGTAKIGSYTEIKEEDGTSSYTDVKGVDLSSIYNEWVIVNGQMSGDYKVILITQYEYNANVNHYVGQIGNTAWANFKNFECFKEIGTNTYNKSLLAMKNVDSKTIIRLANPDPIAMPGISGDDAIIGDVNTGFGLGENRISSECSVFSVSVQNGSFTVPETTINGGTRYLAQPTPTTYSDTFDTESTYVYMHVLSETNSITSEDASKFLAGMIFRRSPQTPDIPVTIKVHLETVPYVQIKAAAGATLTIDDFNGDEEAYNSFVKPIKLNSGETNKGFAYFDGSYYLGVSTSSNINWINAYNRAKSMKFNGLTGYLINITSEVENSYIFNQMGLGKCWTGGARYDTAEDHSDGSFTCYLNETYHVEYDSDTRTSPGAGFRIDSPHYRWQAGPEAGQIFTTGEIPAIMKYSSGKKYTVTSYNTWYPTRFYIAQNSELDGQEVYLLNSSDLVVGTATIGKYTTKNSYYTLDNRTGSGQFSYAVRKSDFVGIPAGTDTGNGTYTNRDFLGCYTNWDETPEPNDSNKGQSEECVHFLEGGAWNDYSWNYNGVTGYIVEFTPYKTKYGEEKFSAEVISKSASY